MSFNPWIVSNQMPMPQYMAPATLSPYSSQALCSPGSFSDEVRVRQSMTPVKLSPNSNQLLCTKTWSDVNVVNGKRVTDTVTVQVRRTVTKMK